MYIFLSFKVEKCLIYQVLQGLSIISGHLINSAQTFEFDDKLLEVTLEKNLALLVVELAIKLSSSHTIHRHFQQLKKDLKLGKWVPQELCENNLKS